MAFRVPGLEAFSASLYHCASRDIGATTRVVQGARSIGDDLLDSLGKLLMEIGAEVDG